jgi:hypothetical protein
MKRMSFILALVLLSLTAAIVTAESEGQQRPGNRLAIYNPAIIYTGDYQPDVLLFKNPWTIAWQRIPKLDHLRYVTCQDALNHLNLEGRWKGHLNPDGSCGSQAEPADWAIGNRLNYENDLEAGQ